MDQKTSLDTLNKWREEILAASSKNHHPIKLKTDRVATTLVPESFDNYEALKCTADGNCLFNSCSIVLTGGSEKLNQILRAAVSLELSSNIEFYENHQFLKKKIEENSEHNEAFITGMAFTNEAADSKNPVKTEAKRISENRKWGSLMAMFALSSVVNRKIVSVYPETSDLNFKIFNGTIEPRQDNESFESESNNNNDIIIMWSRIGNNVSLSEGRYQANHFVPLLQKDQVDVSFQTKDRKAGAKKKIKTTTKRKSLETIVIDNEIPPASKTIKLDPNQNTRVGTKTIKTKSKPLSDYFPKFGHKPSLIKNKENLSPQPKNPQPETLQPGAMQPQIPQPPLTRAENPLPDQNHPPDDNISIKQPQDIDIADVFKIRNTLSPREKIELKYKIIQPSQTFHFPKSGQLSCKFTWLKNYEHLVYSPAKDALYCFACVVMGVTTRSNLTKENGMRCWKMATTKIKQHFQNQHGALEDFKNLTVAIRDPSKSIDVTANRLVSTIVQRNRDMIRPIIATLICLGKCNLAIRGHRDDSKYYLGENTSNSCGNFLSILKLVLEFAPPGLKELVMKCPKNATYKSKTIQNQIIDVIKDYIQGKIVKKIKVKRVFSVLADEATDVSNKEQMALVLRYLNQNNIIKEEFVNFIHCKTGTSGMALSQNILDEVKALGLDFEDVRGQGYDGAGAMAGNEKGCAARILKIHRLAVYIHCFAHRLNLSIMKVSNITLVRDVFDHTRVIADFFTNSPKRAEYLEHIFSELDGVLRKLINICRTRWVARILGINRIVESYLKVHKTFSEVAKSGATFQGVKWDAKTQTKANGCRAKMETFAWLVALVITKNIFFYIDSITTGLQATSLSIVEAYLEITNVIETLEGVKLNVNKYHKKWYTEAVELAAKIGINPKCPRVVCGVSMNRDSTPSNTEEEYFRRTITIRCLNEVINDLRERFDANSIGVIDGFYCIPSVMAVKTDWKLHLRKFMMKYKKDMPDLSTAESEIHRWETTWLKGSQDDTLPSTIEGTMKTMLTTMFPNIYQTLIILAVVPVTTCSCERSISTLKRVKNYLRNSCGQDRLVGLVLLHMNKEMDIDIDEIINRLAIKYPKRMKMSHLLDDD